MISQTATELRNGFCVYIDTFCQGAVPAVTDADGNYVVFETELEAQREIVDHQMRKLQQFLDGERDYDDAITTDEFVVPVTVHPDGVIVDAVGNPFHPNA